MESKHTTTTTIKFLYSYGGKILPRFTDGKLRYSGGHTRVLAIHPPISFSELVVKLGELCGSSVKLKCALPNGDLEMLISITNDEDLENIIEVYDRASSSLPHPLKIRAILLPPKSECVKKFSPPQSSTSSSSASHSHSPLRSAYGTAGSFPYAAVHRLNRPPVSVIGFRKKGALKGFCSRSIIK